jgi:hypothetical protein
MVCLQAEQDALPAESYRREARRLRASFSGDIHRLQSSLRRLAIREDAEQRIRARESAESARRTTVVRHVIRADSCEVKGFAVDRFAALVELEIQSGILRHSQRMALLRQAKHSGISRFDANLIIASVQHRFNENHPATISASSVTICPRRRFVGIWVLLSILAVEIPIAIAAWKILHP